MNYDMGKKRNIGFHQYHLRICGCSFFPHHGLDSNMGTAAASSANCAGIFKQNMGARNCVGIGILYRPARLHSPEELVPWNQFLGLLKV